MGEFKHTLQSHVKDAPPTTRLEDFPVEYDGKGFCILSIGVSPGNWAESTGLEAFVSRTPRTLDDWADQLGVLAKELRQKADQLKADEDAEQALRADIESNDQVNW